MELLERAPVLDELDGVLAATATGGRVVLVAGEAGIGKSALVRRFTERHPADARFLLGACDPLLTPRALGPLHDLGRQTGGRLAELLAGGSSREQLGRSPSSGRTSWPAASSTCSATAPACGWTRATGPGRSRTPGRRWTSR